MPGRGGDAAPTENYCSGRDQFVDLVVEYALAVEQVEHAVAANLREPHIQFQQLRPQCLERVEVVEAR